MNIYLNTYHPLCSTDQGKEAIERYGYRRFSDYSIRREPDFEHEYSFNTAICRGKGFAPKLKVGDVIFYFTVQGKYLSVEQDHWRLIAL